MKRIITSAVLALLGVSVALAQPSKALENLLESVRLIAEKEEEPLEKTIALFQSEIQQFNTVEQAIINSMIAESLWAYLRLNRYAIFARTTLATPDLSDIRTWDTRLLLQQCIDYYEASLQPQNDLQQVPVRSYKAMLNLGDDMSEVQRPTLFDLLAFRAIQAWGNEDLRLTQPRDGFSVDDPRYLLRTETFQTLDIPEIDPLSLDYRILKTYQAVCQFHARQNNPNVLIPLDLQRMLWVRKKAVFGDADSLYNLALRDYLLVYPNSEATSQIYWALAEHHAELGERYNSLVSEDYREEKKTAMNYVEILLNRYPTTRAAQSAKALSEQLKQPKTSLQMQEVILPKQHNLFLLRYANIDTVYFHLYRLSGEDWNVAATLHKDDFLKKIMTEKTVFKQWQTAVPNPGDYQTHRTEMSLEPLLPTAGCYLLMASSEKDFSMLEKDSRDRPSGEFSAFSVSELTHFSIDQNFKGMVMNRRTGNPISGAKIHLYSKTYNYQTRQMETTELATLTSSKNGHFEYLEQPQASNISIELQYKSDTLLPLTQSHYWHSSSSSKPSENWQKQLFLFTDRVVYRPGQTVYFKGIWIERKGEETRLVTHTATTVKLFNANRKETSAIDVTTNEYGSFSGQFFLPASGLNGQHYLQGEAGACFFSVEEYKRPTFEITFNPLKEAYQLDRELTVSGVAKTYSGAGLGQSKVKYKVSRSVVFPMWGRVMRVRPQTSETVMTQGEAVCDERGQFQISFIAQQDKTVPLSHNPTYVFVVTTEVTDISGETQTATQTVRVSQKALNVSLKVRSYVDRTKDSILPIVSTNLAGEKTPSRGTVKVFRLIPDRRLLHDRLWENPDQYVLSEQEFIKRFPNDPYRDENAPEHRDREFGFEKTYDTEVDSVVVLERLAKWEPGEYYYIIESQDVFGNPVSGVNFFTVYSPQRGNDALEQIYYTIFPKNTFEPGETASWIIGSATRITVFYEIRGRQGVLEHKMVTLNNEQKRIEFPIKEEHRGNLSLQIWTVKNNRLYNTNETIFVPFSNRNINLSFETFRDKLTPNVQEKWTLQLLSNDRKPLQGELLLGMYDASLDVFRKGYWNMDLNRYFYAAGLWKDDGFKTQGSQTFNTQSFTAAYPPAIRYDALNFVPPFFGRRGGLMQLSASAKAAENADFDQVRVVGNVSAMKNSSADHVTTLETSESTSSQSSETPAVSVVPRTNLNETAFFYPFLRSDEHGKISVTFTVPESLTRWRIQGLAHTQDLKVGLAEWSAVTQKSVMIYPNVPRFLREGDHIKFQAKIVDLSGAPISGTANLIVNESTTLPQEQFSIAALQNASVGWLYRANGVGLLDLKFLAEAGNHTDGEVRTIPVLSNRTLVTETKPLFALPKTEQKYSFEKLAKPQSKTLENYRLTLEITTNPIWFAVQALPELSAPNSENSVALFGAYFANAMAMDILKRNPTIKDVFNRWKLAGSETLQSNLETNQELKSVLLEETPWVLSAESETRQKHSIALYFDENNVRDLQAGLLTRLQKAQLPNGGFAWYPGGRDDQWSTQYVVQVLQKLHRRNIERDNFELQTILRNALTYCDSRRLEWYAKHKKEEPYSLSAYDIFYLYLRTYFAEEYPVSPELAEVLAFYDSLAKKTWKEKSRYLQGILALYFDHKGEQKLVQEVMQNFRRLALKSAEMGMYWRYESSWFWYESAIETQSQLIETFEKLGQPEEVALMKQWLLTRKRTTRWNTTKASVEAIYALLNNTPNLSENTDVDIQIGDERISSTTNADAGSGYFKTFWTAEKMQPKQANITIKNRGDAMVWGGLYWQYFENLDQIQTAKTPLSIEKKLFVERMTDRGPMLDTIPAKGLQTGEKVTVRIEIRVDRDMEYVHLKDLRAAAFEPMNERSGYRYQDGLSYYQELKDVSMNFYFTHLPKGTYVFEYRLIASQTGDFSNGYTTIQCLYAPEFSAQSEGQRVVVQ